MKTIASINRNDGTLNLIGPGPTRTSSTKDDALRDEECAYSRMTSMGRRAVQRIGCTVIGSATEVFRETAACLGDASSSVLKGDQSNTSVKLGDSPILKPYRRVEPGMNPRSEVGQRLWLNVERHAW